MRFFRSGYEVHMRLWNLIPPACDSGCLLVKPSRTVEQDRVHVRAI